MLEKRVGELIKQISALKSENDKLRSEAKYIQGENNEAKKSMGEYKVLFDERAAARKKITSILGKFEKLKI